MTKIVWMSDPHFQKDGTIGRLDPRARLKAAITHINTHYADADFAVMSGDLIGDDADADYAALSPYLAKLSIPLYPMVGNNDQRKGLRQHLPLPADCMADFIQYKLDTPDGAIICLDSHKPGVHTGEFCEKREQWLSEVLGKLGETPAYIFMHHPPMALGLPMQDQLMLEDGDRFLDLLEAHPNVKHLFMGHVHRTTCGAVRGIPFATIGALSFQAPAPRPAWDWDSFAPPAEPPTYGVIDISGGNVTVQFIQFCDYEVGIGAL